MSNSNEDLKAGINFLCRSLPKWGLLILKQGTDKQNYLLVNVHLAIIPRRRHASAAKIRGP